MRNFKKFLALVLAMMMVVGGMVTVSAAEETAAAEYDYTAAAEALAELGIVKGTSDDVIDFALEDKVVRYQMALLVARIMTGEVDDSYWNKVVENTTPFDDVTKYYGAIAYVADNEIVEGKGWIAGVGDNCFDPEGPITYEQALTMAVRALGYKQLVYPTGFVNTAKELGLTEGLEELAGDTQLTRGQMFQIIYNLFFTAGKDGSDFATKAFGLQTETYVVVATELQALLGADRVYRVDYEGKGKNYDKYVALAPINEDGTYNLDAVIHMTETELGMDQKESEYRLGYSYVIKSFDKFANAYIVEPCDTKTLKNYGVKGAEITSGAKYHNLADDLLKLDGVTYKMVDKYTNLNNKSYANRNPELIVHSMFAGDTTSVGGYYIYDEMFNILDPEDTTVKALIYNQWTNTYYVKVGEGYRVATDDDFAKYAVNNDINTTYYGIVTDVNELLNDVEFCEITLFDDNDDGVWDRGLYIPYSMGEYNSNSSTNVFDFDTLSTSKVANAQINGKLLGGNGETSNGKFEYKDAIASSSIDFIGEARPKAGDYVVYWYNPQGRVFCTLELSSITYTKVTALNQGTYSYDSKTSTYYWKNATVTVEGEDAPLQLGYRPYVTASKNVAAPCEYDLEYINADIALYGYDKVIYECLANSTYLDFGYVVLADRVVDVAKRDTRAKAGTWMVFDYGTWETVTDPYTSYDYEGDILGVDEDGNIMVNAYVQGQNTQVVAKIGSINGFDSYGDLVADYAALNFNFTGIGILGNDQYETMKKIVIGRFFDTLTKDLGTDARQMVYTVTDVDADGVYSIYTDVAIYWGNDPSVVNVYRQPSYAHNPSTLPDRTFTNGVANVLYNNKLQILTEDSLIVVVGKDGIGTATGVPSNGATTYTNNANTYVLAWSNEFILYVNPTVSYEDMYTGKFDTDHRADGYTYYLVVGKNAGAGQLAGGSGANTNTAATVTWDINGVGTYTYSNLYCLNTGDWASKTVVGGLEGFTTSVPYTQNVVAPLGAVYAEKNGKFTLINTIETGKLAATNNIENAKYGTDAIETITALIYNTDPEAKYAPVYDTYGIARGGSNYAWNWKYTDPDGVAKEITETAFSLNNTDQIYVYTDINDCVIWVQMVANNNASAFGAGGTIYFEYIPGQLWHGTFLGGCDKGEGVRLIHEYAAADKFEDIDLTELVATYIANVNSQTNTDNIMAQVDAFKAAADKALADANLAEDEQALADAKEAAIAKIAAVADKYDDALVLANDTTVAAQEAAFVDAINACTLADQTYLTQIDAKAEWFEEACAAAQAAVELADAQTAAIAAIDAAVEKTADDDGYSTSTFKSSSTKYTIAEWYTRIINAINAQTDAADVDPLTIGTITKSIEDWATYMADYVADAKEVADAAEEAAKPAYVASAEDGAFVINNAYAAENAKNIVKVEVLVSGDNGYEVLVAMDDLQFTPAGSSVTMDGAVDTSTRYNLKTSGRGLTVKIYTKDALDIEYGAIAAGTTCAIRLTYADTATPVVISDIVMG